MVGVHHLHKNVAIVCAGNLESDNAIVQPMSTAMQSRLVHLELVVDTKEWTEWASAAGVDHRITSYINFKPGQLYTFKPDHSDHTYASPRTWEFADRVLKVTAENDPDLLSMLAGTLSEGVAREFMVFCKVYQDLPTIAQILQAPDSIKVPVEPSILYAVTGSISHHATEANCAGLLAYVSRLPMEFQVVCIRDVLRRNKPLLANPTIQGWISANKNQLF